MPEYAVIETGGKQYRVTAGDVFAVERLDADVGKKVKLDQVLAVSNGKELTVGTPLIKGAAITAEVVEHFRGDKVIAFKKKRRKGYTRKVGHRQELTRLKIENIGKTRKTKSKAEAPAETAAATPADLPAAGGTADESKGASDGA